MSNLFRQRVAILLSLVVFSSGCAHTIAVYSSPPGAQVLIDSQPTGQQTPTKLRVKDLNYGSHLVSVAKEGYAMTGDPQEVRIGFRTGLVVATVFFFYTPFPWISAARSGYKGVTYPPGRRIPIFQMTASEP